MEKKALKHIEMWAGCWRRIKKTFSFSSSSDLIDEGGPIAEA